MKRIFAKLSFFSLTLILFSCVKVNSQKVTATKTAEIELGATQMNEYLPLIASKKVALVVNNTSMLNKKHLVDSLLERNVNIVKIFAPEHGFRGTADAGELVKDGKDEKTGLPIVSLYGKNKKPFPEQLTDIDVVIFDIQDVGARFYTYISTLHYVMEACAENNKQVIVLDRPNPNGHYVDGPVLNLKYRSFIGMNPIPVVHGCTMGEIALMENGEKWLEKGVQCNLKVILCKNYTHQTPYILPQKPSPNLPNNQAILLYPSICFFEGTEVSVGRGTDTQFQVIGSPTSKFGNYTFTPVDKAGAMNPPQEGKLCYGLDLRNVDASKVGFTLKYLIDFYKKAKNKEEFFLKNNFINLLAGTDELKKQIVAGKTEAEIRKTWEADLNKYKEMRKKYLLYK